MASTDKAADPEAPPKSEAPPAQATTFGLFLNIDVGLRILLFAATLVSVVVMVTSDQTENVFVPALNAQASRSAKFNHSPAFIYFVAALSVASFYSIITALASLSVIIKPDFATTFLLQYAIWDVVVFGLVASATGAAGSVAYLGLKGNSHASWGKICNTYDKYCRHVGSSVFVSLFASVILVFLITLSIVSLSKKIPK